MVAIIAAAGPLLVLGSSVVMSLGVGVVLAGIVMTGSMISSKRTHRD